MIQIIDISKSILYDQAQAKTELLTLVNVTVSHEMRNPLNSIMNLNADLSYTLDLFKDFIAEQSKQTAFAQVPLSFLARLEQLHGDFSRIQRI